jgi:hypothetical protein
VQVVRWVWAGVDWVGLVVEEVGIVVGKSNRKYKREAQAVDKVVVVGRRARAEVLTRLGLRQGGWG